MSLLFASGARRLFTVLSVVSLPAVAAAEQGWNSHLLGRELVIVEKTVTGDPSSALPLPLAIQEKVGPDFVDYDSFVAVRLPAGGAAALTTAALREGRSVLQDPRLPVVLPFHSFRPESPGERRAPWAGHRLQPSPVPSLYLIRFAFPILPEWSDALRMCGADPILYYGNGVFLTRARSFGVIRSCSAARYLDWAEPFLTTDRTSPTVLESASLEMRPYSLTFVPGTSLETALSELPASVEVGDHMTWQDGTFSVGILAGAPELEDLLRTSLHLLSIQEGSGEPQPSDERQGQIVAGNYAGYPGAISGAVSTPGYLTWLTNRGLHGTTNQQTVAVFDTGYDDGTGVTGAHHPDLENPERLVDVGNFIVSPSTPATEDHRGHGTMVAGIIAGDGTQTNTKDTQGFHLGTGIAPKAKLVAVQIMDNTSTCAVKNSFFYPPTQIENAISFARVNSSGGDKALIGNHSWNIDSSDYEQMSKLLDERVIDGDGQASSGQQPMTMVVSAGNNGASGAGTILSPANAKNVITVGSTQSYRPFSESGAAPSTCEIALPASFLQDASNIGAVSAYSSLGVEFARFGQGKPLAHTVRIKPDLVAPGGRVTSTVPYDANTSYSCGNLCRKYWPAGTYYSYSSGTSFSAPVASGVVALTRKWFLDRGTTPSPSLLKAALIATATDLGAASNGDSRPSHRFGWGRVDLNRLTDPSVARFYVTDNAGMAVATGQERTWTRTIDNPSRPVFISLVWSDSASPSGSLDNPPLINDLRLTVELAGGNLVWYGNNFEENINGNDSGFSQPYVQAASGATDSVNTVEAVFIPANTFSAGAQIILRVKGTNALSPQKFAIYAYNVRLSS